MQSFLVSVVVVLSAFSHHVIGIPLMSFYPFGNDTGDTALPPNDDESSGLINLTMPYPFFGENRATAFVSPNQPSDHIATQSNSCSFLLLRKKKMYKGYSDGG